MRLSTDEPTSWRCSAQDPPFLVGAAVLHPAHGLLTVVAITRRVPASLASHDPFAVARVAMVTCDPVPEEIYVDEATGKVGLRPPDLQLVDEDVYLLEAPAMALYVRVAEAVAWGARAREPRAYGPPPTPPAPPEPDALALADAVPLIGHSVIRS